MFAQNAAPSQYCHRAQTAADLAAVKAQRAEFLPIPIKRRGRAVDCTTDGGPQTVPANLHPTVCIVDHLIVKNVLLLNCFPF